MVMIDHLTNLGRESEERRCPLARVANIVLSNCVRHFGSVQVDDLFSGLLSLSKGKFLYFSLSGLQVCRERLKESEDNALSCGKEIFE